MGLGEGEVQVVVSWRGDQALGIWGESQRWGEGS